MATSRPVNLRIAGGACPWGYGTYGTAARSAVGRNVDGGLSRALGPVGPVVIGTAWRCGMWRGRGVLVARVKEAQGIELPEPPDIGALSETVAGVAG